MKTGKNVMKKLLIVLLTLGLVMSATACGSSKDASSQQPDPSNTAETNEIAEDNTADNTPVSEPATEPSTADNDAEELYSLFTEAYMGLTEDGMGVYYAGSSDGEIALLMILDGDTSEHYVFVGPIVDNGDGTVTITDEEDGLSLTFGITALDDGVEIDMGDELGTAVLGEVSVKEVIDIMLQIESATTAIIPDSAGDMSFLNDAITEAYTGAFDDETTVYLAGNEDDSLMVIALLSPDKAESIIYAGSATAKGDYIKLTDDTTGNELAFNIYEEGGSMILDMGSVGTTVISEITTADMIATLEAIIAETEVLR